MLQVRELERRGARPSAPAVGSLVKFRFGKAIINGVVTKMDDSLLLTVEVGLLQRCVRFPVAFDDLV